MLQWVCVGLCLGAVCSILADSLPRSLFASAALCLGVVIAVKGF